VRLRLGARTTQHRDRTRRRTERAAGETARVDEPAIAGRMIEEANLVARALHDAGYFGPFGVDAFTYSGGLFQPRSEINARYSMGFSVGFGSL
jgi:hypothetical protein